jgi:hypothetical protein
MGGAVPPRSALSSTVTASRSRSTISKTTAKLCRAKSRSGRSSDWRNDSVRWATTRVAATSTTAV